jgi:hypothetical protein
MFPTATSSVELRLHVWHENQQMAEHILSQQKTLDGQAMILCDTTDEVGGPLSNVLAEKAGCAQQMAEQRQKIEAKGTEFQTTVSVLPVGLVAALMISTPTVAEALRRPCPSGMIYVVIIGSGGTTLIVTPRPVRRPSAGVG